jgi:Protein of unknown function (DUF3822)
LQPQEIEIFPERKIIDEKYFNIENLSDYNLQLSFSSSTLDFCIVDSRNNRCLYLEENKLDDFNQGGEFTSWIDQLFDSHHFLKAGYWKSIQLSIKNEKFTLVPTSLFMPACAKEYLQFNCALNPSEEITYFHHKALNITSIFAYPTSLVKWLNNIYPHKEVQLVHHTSAFLEGVMREASGDTEIGVYANVGNELLTLIVKKGNALEFCNNFLYKDNNDILYYTLFVLDQLKLNKNTPITYWGNIDTNSELFHLLTTYIRQVEIGGRPNVFFYSYVFDELAEQQHFDLLSIKLCL